MKLRNFERRFHRGHPFFVGGVKFETHWGFKSCCVVVKNFSKRPTTRKEAELQPEHYTQVQDVHTVDGKSEPG